MWRVLVPADKGVKQWVGWEDGEGPECVCGGCAGGGGMGSLQACQAGGGEGAECGECEEY